MTINRYTAATMQQALARVKAALGPEAVILETASAPGEVTVTAAVDRMPAPIGAASGELVGEVRQLLGVVRELVDEHWRRERPGLGRELLPLQRALLAQGVDGVIAAALVQATEARLGRGAPVLAAAGARALVQALARAADADLVLVDTAGAGPGQGPQLAELAALAEAAGAGAARTLVASAAAGSSAAARTWQAFAPLAPEACVLTKLDLAPGGPMLGLLWRRGVPVSHVAAGRRIPDDLEPATPDRLARCLLAA